MAPEFVKVGKYNIDSKEYLAPGHTFCTGCGEALAIRLVCKALGENTIIGMATGCDEVCTSPLPVTSWRLPWLHTLFENAGAEVSGMEAGLKAMMRKGKAPQRDIKFVAMAGDGGTSDIGLQSLSGALERGHDFLYVCWDNEAYMNTGIQRSSATPYGASTTTAPAGKLSMGQQTQKKNMVEICVAHEIPYAATACPSYPFEEGGRSQGAGVRAHIRAVPDRMADAFEPDNRDWQARRRDRRLPSVRSGERAIPAQRRPAQAQAC